MRDALALDQRVRDKRRSVHEMPDGGDVEPGIERLHQDPCDRLRRIAGRRQRLADRERSGLAVDDDEVGERAADIRADPKTSSCHRQVTSAGVRDDGKSIETEDVDFR